MKFKDIFRIGWFGCLAVVAAFASWPTPSSARNQQLRASQSALATSATLDHDDNPVFWNGMLDASIAPTPDQPPDVCNQAKCARFDLTVELPDDTFKALPGGILIGNLWGEDDDSLDLYVYRDGVQIANSASFVANLSQSVILPNVTSGTFAIYAAFDVADSADTVVPFEAFADIQHLPAMNPIRQLLPNLTVRPQTNIQFVTPSFPLFEPDPPPGSTCFTTEQQIDGAHTCLRFDSIMPNVGEGPLEARFAFPHDPNDTSQNVFQRTYYSDGQGHVADTLIGQYYNDPQATANAQLPFRFFDHYALTQLWLADNKGQFAAASPLRSAKKASFCVEDERLDNVLWGKNGVAARNYFAPYCLFPTVTVGNFDYAIQGLSIGWQDLYEFYLPGQYIEVSGLPDGDYILTTTVNPDRVFIETDYDDNCVATLIHLENVDSPNRSVTMLGPGPKCR